MKIDNLKTNRIRNPLGFEMDKPSLSYVVSSPNSKKQKQSRIEVALTANFSELEFDSGWDEKINSIAYPLDIELKPRQRYYWRVNVVDELDNMVTSDVAWFETGRLKEEWQAQWIGPTKEISHQPSITKRIILPDAKRQVKSARAYICGLGLYEMCINGEKCGDEYFAPNFNAYDKWLQYQTYDIETMIKPGENLVEILLGDGLYKGRFGFDSETDIYGDRLAVLCEIIIEYDDGSVEVFKTDESWNARNSTIVKSNIYDGEFIDESCNPQNEIPVEVVNIGYEKLQARLSLPVKIKEKRKPKELIITPNNETVLDVGQNMVGWLQFRSSQPLGTKVKLQYCEVLQDGNFYNDNLRTAKAEFTYVSSGKETVVRPHFTFYGFRYVKITGWQGTLDLDDFDACVIYSDMEVTGKIETSNALVNRLFENILWGQKGNFLDVPTDCPQRDERMGWTGDAQVFSGTANFNMDTYAFFTKYLHDLKLEQLAREGMVPMVVPAVNLKGGGSCGWGDAATIIPWNVYVQSGDKKILERQFESMVAWVEYIKKEDDKSEGQRLWTTGFHFGDWLALDGTNPDFPTGATDIDFVASAYYYLSTTIVAKTAKVIENNDASEKYDSLAKEIKEAFISRYFDAQGEIKINTQTALVLALYLGLIPSSKREWHIDKLRLKISKDNNHLTTGFIGTPLICKVLSEVGCNDLAYTLLLNDDFPSWLYAVNMGATTIWERWDSILPNGKINGAEMNSLNHYAYGAIGEWMYRYMVGINPVENRPGFAHVVIKPMVDRRLEFVRASYNSPKGEFRCCWQTKQSGGVIYEYHIPFDATANLTITKAGEENLRVNGELLSRSDLNFTEDGDSVSIFVEAGDYKIETIA